MTRVGHRRRRRQAGISTAEILVGTTLSLMALASLYAFHLAQTKALAAQNAYNESQTVTRTVIDLMARELRMATYDPTGLALPTSPGPTCPGVKQGILEATPTKIHILQDLTGDGTLVSTAESVVYDTAGSQLRRIDGIGLPLTVVDGVVAGGFNLRYFDGSNPPVELVPSGSPPALSPSQRDCVAKVRVTIKANVANPGGSAPLDSVAETEVAIRNRSLQNF